jgi:signal recognition particle subunit SRP54
MFDSLSGKFQDIFKNLKGHGKISDSNVSDALREVRMSLLEADVNFRVVKDFINRVKEKAIGEKVIQSIQPGQQIIKVIKDEMVELLGSEHSGLQMAQKGPTVIMMVGLHGSGKTTSSGKLAKLLKKQGRRPLLVAADVYRPAAMDQLATLGEQVEVPVHVMKGETDVLKIARKAGKVVEENSADVVIYDTAGRLQIDENLVQELVRLKKDIQPDEILLVLDAATGQEAVSVATHFNDALGITGCILTKLDGDARGGAALSMKAVTGTPIKFAGTGEKLDAFEPFHPDRVASRILGMGDVVSLVEKAAEAVDEAQAKKMEEKMRKGVFTMEDFLEQLRQMKKLGSLESVVGMLPGAANNVQQRDIDKAERDLKHMEAMICSMTPQERRNPQILNARRRQRIAKGSGTTVAKLNNMLKEFAQMQKMMKQMGKFQKMMTKMGGKGMPGMMKR